MKAIILILQMENRGTGTVMKKMSTNFECQIEKLVLFLKKTQHFLLHWLYPAELLSTFSAAGDA